MLTITMVRTSVSVIIGLLVLWLVQAESTISPKITCTPDKKFLQEKEHLVCECEAPNAQMKHTELFWRNKSNSSTLRLNSVNRRDNGDIYSCIMKWNNMEFVANYTLKVAYGPSEGTVKVDGPLNFVTDGSRNLTLSCKAHDVNPQPVYTWQNKHCNHGKKTETCTFMPKLWADDNTTIRCTATNFDTDNTTVISAEYVLDLKYPPREAPVIKGHRDGQIHQTGDNLTCSVEGGKPRVSEVIFNCTNPPLEDQEDDYVGERVISSLTISSATNLTETVCTCAATWDPESGLYNLTATISFAVRANCKSSKRDGDRLPKGAEAGITIVIVVAAIVLFIICLIKKRKKRNRSTRDGPREGNNTKSFEQEDMDTGAADSECGVRLPVTENDPMMDIQGKRRTHENM